MITRSINNQERLVIEVPVIVILIGWLIGCVALELGKASKKKQATWMDRFGVLFVVAFVVLGFWR